MKKQWLFALSLLVLSPGIFAAITQDATKTIAALEAVKDSDFYQNARFSKAQVELGRKLFFDKVLSGNRNISCSSCHHPELGTSDGVALPLGEGATGLGRNRRVKTDEPMLGRVPRNSQALYFLGAREYSRLFHDGRVEVDDHNNWPSGYWSPAREQLPAGLDNVLAVQAMFPVISDIEMAGHKGENEIANAVASDQLNLAWNLLADRLRQIPEYVRLFKVAYPSIKHKDQIQLVQAANAIAAFETVAFRADGSPFDQYLTTRDPDVLGDRAYRGMKLFYGSAGCGDCHSGKLQSDQQFHAIAVPQLGPGKNDGWDQSYWQKTGYMARVEDYGRARVTQREEDKYRFRTPSLRNVELTAPYGHSGVFNSLEDMVRHHADPVGSLNNYQVSQAILPPLDNVIETTAEGSQLIYRPVNPARLSSYLMRDIWVIQSQTLRQSIADANELQRKDFSENDIADLVSFLKALTDPQSKQTVSLIPESVPSGLDVDQ